MGWYLRPGISWGQWFYTQCWCSMMVSWLNHVLLRWVWFPECHCWCVSVKRSTPLLRGFSVIFSLSVIARYTIIYLMLSFGPHLAFLSPWQAYQSGQFLSATQSTVCLSCVDIFSAPVSSVYFQVCSMHVYWCIFLLCLFYFCLTYSGRYYTFLLITQFGNGSLSRFSALYSILCVCHTFN